jgi:hypothetical protein
VLRNIYTILKRPFNGFYFGHKQQDLGQKIHILPFLAKLFYKKCVAVVIRVIDEDAITSKVDSEPEFYEQGGLPRC